MEANAEGVADRMAFGHVTRFASALARPFDSFDESAWSSASLPPREMRNLSASPYFGSAVRAVAMRTVVGSDFNLPATTVRAMAGTAEGRLVLGLVSAPVEEIEQIGLLVAAAVLHRAVLHTTVKTERQRVQLALGPTAFVVATQEAPVLYPALAMPEAPDILRALLPASMDEPQVRRGFVGFGLAQLLPLAGAGAPMIARLVQRHLPPDFDLSLNGRMPELDRDLIVKLIRRRVPSWSAIIG
ncbi:MAG: hypothetical protein ACT6U0_04810 [Shinella sp.]|uniref:hypothetical protein n=1 Tax=Shinella sp. TaxID=1870904 RepID=UPI00403535CF